MDSIINGLISITALAITFGIPAAVVCFLMSVFNRSAEFRITARRWALWLAGGPMALLATVTVLRLFFNA